MLKQRLIVSLGLLPLFIAIVWFGEPWFTILIAGWGLIAAYEFFTLVKNTRILPLILFGLLWIFLFIVSPYFKQDIMLPLLLTSAVIIPLILLLSRHNKE